MSTLGESTSTLGSFVLGIAPSMGSPAEAMCAFTRAMGTSQGRFTPQGGSALFVLGNAEQRRFERLNIGDRVDITQTASLTGAPGDTKFLRLSARLDGPAAVPAGVRWKFSMLVDNVEVCAQFIRAGSRRTRVDFAAYAARLAGGDHAVTLRLEVAPP